MTESAENNYAKYRKIVWVIYALIVAVLIVILALIVAQDNEERLFYSLMTAAASYVFRPGDRLISKAVLRLYNLSPPQETDANK